MNYSDITVVIPTINEKSTIGTLVRFILSRYHGAKILVIDDGSSDGTEREVQIASKGSKDVHFFDRKKKNLQKGLTYSMIDGIFAAKTRYVILMDGDMQHPPELIPRIARNLSAGSKIVIAARQGSYNPVFYRHMISQICTTVGSTILILRGSARSADIFSGYFGIDARYAKTKIGANRRRFVGEGYKFLFDMLKCTERKVKISEIPYTLRKRRHGSSKAHMQQGIALVKSLAT